MGQRGPEGRVTGRLVGKLPRPRVRILVADRLGEMTLDRKMAQQRGLPRLNLNGSAQRVEIAPLPPGRVDRFADQVLRIRAGPRLELLEAPGVDLRHVEVALLVGADAVHAPQRAWEVGHRSP